MCSCNSTCTYNTVASKQISSALEASARIARLWLSCEYAVDKAVTLALHDAMQCLMLHPLVHANGDIAAMAQPG